MLSFISLHVSSWLSVSILPPPPPFLTSPNTTDQTWCRRTKAIAWTLALERPRKLRFMVVFPGGGRSGVVEMYHFKLSRLGKGARKTLEKVPFFFRQRKWLVLGVSSWWKLRATGFPAGVDIRRPGGFENSIGSTSLEQVNRCVGFCWIVYLF